MLSRVLSRVPRRRDACRAGHSWTARAYPPACARCGRSRPGERSAPERLAA